VYVRVVAAAAAAAGWRGGCWRWQGAAEIRHTFVMHPSTYSCTTNLLEQVTHTRPPPQTPPPTHTWLCLLSTLCSNTPLHLCDGHLPEPRQLLRHTAQWYVSTQPQHTMTTLTAAAAAGAAGGKRKKNRKHEQHQELGHAASRHIMRCQVLPFGGEGGGLLQQGQQQRQQGETAKAKAKSMGSSRCQGLGLRATSTTHQTSTHQSNKPVFTLPAQM
jgi:hypothetical protein